MNKLNLFIISAVIILGLFTASSSQAALVGNTNQAILTASPQTGTYNVNDTFKVSIYVNTGGQNVVVVAAYLNYDKMKFEAVSIDTTGSVFTIEAEKIINSTNGVIKITRGIPSPGVNTTNGLVAAINFKAIAATSPASDNLTFQFTAGATLESNVILNDGLGTDYLNGVYNAKYTVSSSGTTPPTCASFTYSDWSSCQPDNTQSRTITSSTPQGCDGGSPVLSQSCAYTSPLIPPTPTPTPTPVISPQPSAISYQQVTGPFSIGMTSEQVKVLQQMLATDPVIYPEGTISGYYGTLTQKAIERFQCKYNIVCSGTPETTGYGMAGPVTRQKLNEVYGGAISAQPAQIAPQIEAGKQQLIEQIKAQIALLQQKLVQLLSELAKLLQERINASQ